MYVRLANPFYEMGQKRFNCLVCNKAVHREQIEIGSFFLFRLETYNHVVQGNNQ